MKKNIKKIFLLVLIIALFIQNINFAAIVSDNDGSAFVTKAEFDALKTGFAKQIDDYNSSIDGKIDGAIASYLAGMKIVNTVHIPSLLNKANAAKEVKFLGDYVVPTTQIGGHCEHASHILYMRDSALVISKDVVPNTKYYAYVNNGSKYYYVPNAHKVKIGLSEDCTASWPCDGLQFGKTKTANNQKNIVYKLFTSVDGTYNYTDKDNCFDLTPKTAIVGSSIGGGIGALIINGNNKMDWSYTNATNYDFSGQPYGNVTSSWTMNLTNCSAESNRTDGAQKYPAMGTKQIPVTMVSAVGCDETKCTSTVAPYNGYKIENIGYLAGKQIADTKKIYTVKDSDWYTCHDTPMQGFTKWQAYQQYYYFEDGDPTSQKTAVLLNEGGKDLEGADLGIPPLNVWMKKYQETKITDLVHNDWTSIVGDKIYYYSGMPLFDSNAKQRVKLVLNFNNSTSSQTGTFSIRDAAFTNTDLQSTNVELFADENLTIPYTDFTITSSTATQTKTMYLRAQDAKKYWIKVCPTGSGTIKVNSDIDFEAVENFE